MSLEAKRISILKTEIPVGLHPLEISDIKLHKKSNGDVILYEDNPGIIMTFKNNNLIHQEIYWIGSTNYTKLQRIILQVGLDPNVQIHKKEIVGKSVYGVIKKFVTMRGTEMIKEEFKLTETFDFAGKKPKVSNDLTEYIQDKFNQQAF